MIVEYDRVVVILSLVILRIRKYSELIIHLPQFSDGFRVIAVEQRPSLSEAGRPTVVVRTVQDRCPVVFPKNIIYAVIDVIVFLASDRELGHAVIHDTERKIKRSRHTAEHTVTRYPSVEIFAVELSVSVQILADPHSELAEHIEGPLSIHDRLVRILHAISVHQILVKEGDSRILPCRHCRVAEAGVKLPVYRHNVVISRIPPVVRKIERLYFIKVKHTAL